MHTIESHSQTPRHTSNQPTWEETSSKAWFNPSNKDVTADLSWGCPSPLYSGTPDRSRFGLLYSCKANTWGGSLLKKKQNICTGSRTSYSQIHILEKKLLEHLIPMTLVLRSSLNSTAVLGRSLRLSLQIPPRLQEASLQAHSLFSNGQIPLILDSSLKFWEN